VPGAHLRCSRRRPGTDAKGRRYRKPGDTGPPREEEEEGEEGWKRGSHLPRHFVNSREMF
jgi:hypothetical protein